MTSPIAFSIEDTTDLPRDTVPETVDVEYPCEVCGRESGPYAGRGRKPKRCPEHRTNKKASSSVGKVSGSTATLAAQATQVLAQLNGFMAIGLSAVGMFRSAGAIASYDDTFREQAYNALVTDPELCRYLLRGGVKSAKVALLVAYGGMAVAVAPHAMEEIKEKQAERKARKEVEE